MVSNEENDKLDAKGTKYLFFGYCKGIKAYRLMCMQIEIIVKNRDVIFMENSTRIGNDSEVGL